MIVEECYALQPGEVVHVAQRSVLDYRYDLRGITLIVSRLVAPDLGRGVTAADLVGLDLLSYGQVLRTLRRLGLHFAYADVRRGVAVFARHPLGVWYWRARHQLDRLRRAP